MLPLPLVTFEEYMLADDRHTYPMNFFFRFRLSGHVDRAALQTAQREALSRNPLLHAVVHKPGRSRAEWHPYEGETSPPVWCDAPPVDGYPPCRHLDLSREPGLRLFAWSDGDGDCLLLQFHHACCDGLGAIQFIEDLCVAYGKQTGTALDHRSLDPSLLSGRGRFGLSARKLLRMLPQQVTGLKGVRQFLMRRASPLVQRGVDLVEEPLTDVFPAAVTLRFTEQQTQALRQLAVEKSVTGNDLLLTEVFSAVSEFRQQQGTDDNKWIRFTVPINLRSSTDRRQPATNIVAMVFLDRRPRQIRDPEKLLQSVHDEMDLIKRKQLGLTSVLTLEAARCLPGGLSNCVPSDRCNSTAVVTNLGRVSLMRLPRTGREASIGELRITDFDILAPIRPHTNAAFAIFEYAKRLAITLHYDARVFSTELASELADCLNARLQTLMGRSE